MNTNSTFYSPLYHFAAAYDCNTYGSGAYNESGECVTAATTEQNPNQTTLADTGVNTYLFVGLAALLVIAGVALIIRAAIAKRRRSLQR